MKYLIITLTSFLIVGCSNAPAPINYGSDGCHFCKMTIVDKQHASQIVTIKGRSFKYDAIECMMNDLAKWEGRPETHLLLVADYDQPGTLVDATKASYLISEAIPSPMGEFLTGFQNGGSRDDTATAKGGNSLSWEELREEFLME